jgi:glycosyltransferase involved in cell wall biosynthesis
MKKHRNNKVSLITTERNEVKDIATFIESALSQTLMPDEIVIADGGSTDGTVEIISEYIKNGAPIKLVKAPGNRSVGRNAAVKAAKNEYIACTDVGSRLDKKWLKNITEPFRKNPDAMVVSGGFKQEPKTYFEKISSDLMLSPNDNIDLETWLPSSRSIAFTKTAWKKAGGYPEYTNFNEDTPFDLALKKAGYKFEDGLKAIVYWRPRPNIKEFYKQYYYYALGDALDKIDKNHFMNLLIKYAVILTGTILGAIFYWPIALIFISIFIIMITKRLIKPLKINKGLKAFALMFLLAITFDISQIFGFINGSLNYKKFRGSKKLVR